MSDKIPDTEPTKRHWLQIKARYPDTILLMRAGDVYRAYEDAATAGFVEIEESRVDTEIVRLLQDGHKVATMDPITPVPESEVTP